MNKFVKSRGEYFAKHKPTHQVRFSYDRNQDYFIKIDDDNSVYLFPLDELSKKPPVKFGMWINGEVVLSVEEITKFEEVKWRWWDGEFICKNCNIKLPIDEQGGACFCKPCWDEEVTKSRRELFEQK